MDIGGLIEQVKSWAVTHSGELIIGGVLALAVLVGVILGARYLKLRRRWRRPPEVDLSIDIGTLGTAGPPPGPPMLEHYYVPVRLAAVVLSPAGRAHRLPPPAQLGRIYEAIVPGLAEVVAVHEPLIRRWPEQLSTSGFAHAMFRHVKLPGDGGKGTAWCSAAGMVKIGNQSVMVGLVMRSDGANNFGQLMIKRETQWLDVLRVKQAV
ncbi:MAG: hypothetical protein ACYTG0_36925 [Planctomycetota bacterium]|jgi:hypothetical protein